ncbi:hypothetical protein Gotur_025073, partial [Gossypium turneri]
MHSPYSLGPPPNRRLVRCNPITPLFPSVSITDISCNSHFEFEVGNRDSPSIPNFIFLFLPSSSPDISQFFPFQISTSSSGTSFRKASSDRARLDSSKIGSNISWNQ